jgi:hypothetical protein
MSVFRVKKDKENPYVMVNRYYIYDNRLSLKAKGLMSYFLSRPDDWEFYVEEIKTHTTDKETAITSAIKELLNAGYIKRDIKRNEHGKFAGGYDYIVHEVPIEVASDEVLPESDFSPIWENPESGKSRTGENPNRENPILLNNERIPNNDCSLNNDSCCSSETTYVNQILKHYCDKAGKTDFNISPKDIEAAQRLAGIPIEIALKGIDTAFSNYKPKFDGDKINSFSFCEPIIKSLWETEKAKEAQHGSDRGNNKQDNGNSKVKYDFSKYGG